MKADPHSIYSNIRLVIILCKNEYGVLCGMKKHLRFFLFTVIFTFLSLTLSGICCPIYGVDEVIKNNSAEKELLLELENRADQIYLGEYKLTPRELSTLYQKIKESHPALYYVKSTYSFTYGTDGTIHAVKPAYSMSIEEIRFSRDQITDTLMRFTEQTQALIFDGDKALYVHDFLARNFKYSPAGNENYDVYSALKSGHGVCQAFSLLYILFGESIGLEVDMVTSLSMDHAWNHVKVDGFYYHVDVTRNLSAEPQSMNAFTHDRFLLGDEALKAKGYYDYGCHEDHACGSVNYQSLSVEGNYISALNDIVGSSLYLGERWLSVDRHQIPCILELGFSNNGDSLISYEIDLDGDQSFTLSDILCPEVQNAPEITQGVTEALRLHLLTKAVEFTDEKNT